MVTIAYADGSGKGWACAMIQSEEGYFKTYFKRISKTSSTDVEFEAILLALEKLIDVEEEVWLFSDSKTAIDHINQKCNHNKDETKHWAQRIRRFVKRNGLEVNFYWCRRDGNMARARLVCRLIGRRHMTAISPCIRLRRQSAFIFLSSTLGNSS